MRYGTTDALRGVDFTVRRGEVVTLLGPNGAGKTTVVEILEGFRKRSAGEVSVLGTDPEQADERWRAGVGVVLQSWRDHNKWRVRELLTHLGSYYGRYSTTEVSRPWNTDELIDVVGLNDHADKRIGSLSGGQRRRLDVATGIVGKPELLFLDEPTAGFDPQARHEFHELVRDLSGAETTILLTTHDLDEAEKLGDRVLILVGGRLVADAPTGELSERVSAEAEVRWRLFGQRFTHVTAEPTRFVRELFAEHGEAVEDLEVRRAGLEEIYLSVVRDVEAGRTETAVRELAEVMR
ncbi:ABC transporter ATP-binding protein [Actinopolyspora mortivallis]